MPSTAFFRWTGFALALAGVLTILINACLTPFLPQHVPTAAAATSTIFLWRQSASALTSALLLFGSIGVYLRQAERMRTVGAIAFATAFEGSALLLAWEWVDVFVVRDLASRAPGSLQALEAGPHPTLYDLGAIIPISLFTLGWIALAAATIRAKILSRRAPMLLIAGFFAIPLLGALSSLWGAILGNVILGAGFLGLGDALWHAES